MRFKKIESLPRPRIPSDRSGEVTARRRFRLVAVGVLGALVLVVLVYSWWQSRFVTTTGRVVAHEVRVNSVMRGRIASLPVEEGQRVTAGDLLAQLDPSERRAELKRAEAALEQARSHLQALEDTGLDPRVGAEVDKAARDRTQAEERSRRMRAALVRAEKELARARQSAERTDRVFLLKAVTRSEWERGRSELDRAEADQAAALARVGEEAAAIKAAERILRSTRQALAFAHREHEDNLASRRLAVVQAEAQMEEVRASLEQTSMRAPQDGIVAWLPRKVGEVVDKDDVVVSLIDLDDAWIEAYVSAEQFSHLRDGLPARIRLEGLTPKRYEGRLLLVHVAEKLGERIVRVGPERARSAARLGGLLHVVKIVFEGTVPDDLWPEMIAQVRISKR